jgi:osmotically-inducible protein OsmY
MARFHSIVILTSVLALPAALGGCVGVAVVGGLAAAAGGGYAANQERGINGAASDFTVKADVDRGLIKANPQLQSVSATVYQGRVLLTGRVASEQMKATAEQVASRTPNVRALYDEIEVAPAEGAWDEAKDAWITTRVRSDMVLDPGIRSVNYTIDTTNGSVYLIGSARSQDELDRATRTARYVPGVKRVVSYVEIRGGSPIAASGARPPAGLGVAPSGSAPQAPIEVQKL